MFPNDTIGKSAKEIISTFSVFMAIAAPSTKLFGDLYPRKASLVGIRNYLDRSAPPLHRLRLRRHPQPLILDRGGKVFKQSAPIIKLPENATEDDHLALLGYLNSSVACFYEAGLSQKSEIT